MVDAVRGLIFGKELVELGTGIALTVVASFVNLGLGTFLLRRGKETSSLTLVANGKHTCPIRTPVSASLSVWHWFY